MPRQTHAKKDNDYCHQANHNGTITWVHELDPLQCIWCWQFVQCPQWTNKIPAQIFSTLKFGVILPFQRHGSESAMPRKNKAMAMHIAINHRRVCASNVFEPALLRRQTQSSYNDNHDQHHGDQNFHRTVAAVWRKA